MSFSPSQEFRVATQWKAEKINQYGQLYAISGKAAVEVGYVGAAILAHLWWLQNYTPRGGYLPATDDGERCAFNSFQQMHQRLSFVSLRTLKSQVAKLLKNHPGFSKVKVKGHASNHYLIDDSLAEQLDLDCEGKTLYFHEKEARHHGILKAVLLQHIEYCNTRLSAPLKDAQYVNPYKAWKVFGTHKRTIERALQGLWETGSQGIHILRANEEHGYIVNPWARARWIEHLESSEGHAQFAKPSLQNGQCCTKSRSTLHKQMPKLHHSFVLNGAQHLDNAGLQLDKPLLSNTISIQSTKKNEIARATSPSIVPCAPSCHSLISEKWIEFDCRTPYEASPGMDDRINSGDSRSDEPAKIDLSPARPSPAEREMAQLCTERGTVSLQNDPDVTAAAEPKPCLELISKQIAESGSPSRAYNATLQSLRSRASLDDLYRSQATHQPITLRDIQERVLPNFLQTLESLHIPGDSHTSNQFIRELTSNRELGHQEMALITIRVLESDSMNYAQKYEGKFNPYHHSCGISTAHHLISKFYLILEDIYRVNGPDFFKLKKGACQLREDTPANVRKYIERKRAQRG